MYKCNSCGLVFEEPKNHAESHGFVDGICENIEICPNCGGDFSDAVQCECCQEWFSDDDLIYGYCTNCLDNLASEEDTAVEFINKMNLMPEFMGFLLFDEFSSKEHLAKSLASYIFNQKWKSCKKDVKAALKKYILEDKHQFAVWLDYERG